LNRLKVLLKININAVLNVKIWYLLNWTECYFFEPNQSQLFWTESISTLLNQVNLNSSEPSQSQLCWTESISNILNRINLNSVEPSQSQLFWTKSISTDRVNPNNLNQVNFNFFEPDQSKKLNWFIKLWILFEITIFELFLI
jgi:hypothetical protein